MKSVVLHSSFRNTISVPKGPLSDCQMKLNIVQRIFHVAFPMLQLLGSRYSEASSERMV